MRSKKPLLLAAGEIALIVVFYFVFTASDAPAVNEAHYLTKAKHYWNPAWCHRDLFLASRDAHGVFYWTIGWLTQFLTLWQSAWVARLAGWTFLAICWWRLCDRVIGRAGFALLTAAVSVVLWDAADMAGEWVVGGVESKVFAFGFVWLALTALVDQRWSAVWIWLGAASAFHVLVGGWSVLAATVVWLAEPSAQRPSWTRMLPSLVAGGVVALAGLLPALLLEQGVDIQVARRAHYIYVFERLAHHLLVHHMRPWRIAAHVALIAGWLWWWRRQGVSGRQTRLQRFAAAAVAIAIAGLALHLLIAVSPKRAASLLRFYWFRLSDVMVPVAVTLAFADWLNRRQHAGDPRARRVMAAVLMVLVAVVGCRFAVRRADGRPVADMRSFVVRPAAIQRARAEYADWRDICDWVRQQTPADALCLTPTGRQTFTWYAQRAELVTRKDLPQDASSIVEWRGRLRLVRETGLYRELLPVDETRLQQLAEHYRLDYVVLERRLVGDGMDESGAQFPLVYRNQHFEVRRVALDSLPRPPQPGREN